MAKVILFGGGDGGGLILTEDGVKPIPPLEPSLRLQLRSVSRLLVAQSGISEKETRTQLAALVSRLTNLVVGQLEESVGDIDRSDGIIYQDEEGGFSCGSTGRPPIPFPWPPTTVPAVSDLIRHELADARTVEFLRLAVQRKADLRTLFRSPKKESARLGLDLPDDVARALRGFDVAQAERALDSADREVLEFLNAVVADGRFLTKVTAAPAGVAEELKFDLSADALERFNVHVGGGPVEGDAEAIIALTVVIMIVVIAASKDKSLPVIDRSGALKF
jgi:hypothetical protein